MLTHIGKPDLFATRTILNIHPEEPYAFAYLYSYYFLYILVSITFKNTHIPKQQRKAQIINR